MVIQAPIGHIELKSDSQGGVLLPGHRWGILKWPSGSHREVTMNCMIRCAHCGRHFILNPRVKNQRYCGGKESQRARTALWQKEKMTTDPEYQANQRESYRSWITSGEKFRSLDA